MKIPTLIFGIFAGSIATAVLLVYGIVEISDYVEIFNSFVLAFTAWIVYRYTQETMRLREATEIQTTLSIEPLLSLEEFEGMIAVVNKSGGTARNLTFASSENSTKYDFVDIDSLASNEKKKIEMRVGLDNKQWVLPRELENWLYIEYQNMLMEKRSVKFRRADYGHGFTEKDRDACGPIPDWAAKEYFEPKKKE